MRKRATPQPTERREFTTETLSTQSSECSLIKNSCLRVLRASVVKILLFWKSKTYNNLR
jgi:hypothetical protein